jgi:hypothetical protein
VGKAMSLTHVYATALELDNSGKLNSAYPVKCSLLLGIINLFLQKKLTYNTTKIELGI